MKNVLLCFLILNSLNLLKAQSVGAIAIIGINTDNEDQFAFVAIDDLPTGTTIYFTDSGVEENGSFRGNEGGIAYEVPIGGLDQGEVVGITIANGSTNSFSATVTQGQVSVANNSDVGTNGLNLSSSGDQIIAFTGSTNTPTFIAALQTNSSIWQTTATNSNTSALPPGLSDGSHAVAVGVGTGDGSETDNAEFEPIHGDFKTRTIALDSLNDSNNWTKSNSRITLDLSNFTMPFLPVQLISFLAISQGDHVPLDWTTASEINNDFFEVQRSSDRVNFATIGRVNGNGTTNDKQSYEFIDRDPKSGINYYRLAQYDFNGDMEYHKVISVEIRSGKSTIYPTLVADFVNVVIEEPSTLSIFTMDGRLARNVKLEESDQIDLSQLAPGIYNLRIQTNGQVELHRFIKQ